MKKTMTVFVAAVIAIFAFAVKSSAISDVETRITGKLVEAFGDDAKGIRVTVFEGKATLIGRVSQRSTQELAEEVALFFPEVKKVDNQLKSTKDRSLLQGQLLDESEDAKLEAAVKRALTSEIGKHADKIEVEAADSVVSIRGTVVDEMRRKLAFESASKTKGVKKVVELLRVQQ